MSELLIRLTFLHFEVHPFWSTSPGVHQLSTGDLLTRLYQLECIGQIASTEVHQLEYVNWSASTGVRQLECVN